MSIGVSSIDELKNSLLFQPHFLISVPFSFFLNLLLWIMLFVSDFGVVIPADV